MGQFFEKAYDEMMEIKENSIKESFEKPKVSIIVPAYNTEKYIYKCLLSLNPPEKKFRINNTTLS